MKERLNIQGFITRLWQNFAPAAVLCVALAGLTGAMDWLPSGSQDVQEILSRCVTAGLCGLCLSVLGSLLSRSYKWPRWIDWVFATAGVGLGALLWVNHELAFWGVCAAAVAICVHFAAGQENRARRLGQIVGCFFSSLGLALCLYLALHLCFYAVQQLFFGGNWRIGDLLLSLAASLAFLLAAPWLFLGRLPDNDTPPESKAGFRKVAANLFLPAYLVLLSILLCYILMILIRWEMPVGQMNGLALTALSLFAVLRLSLAGDENRIVRWFFRWGAWLLLPVLAVQQVGVWMRFDAYGLTPSRYGGMVITLLLALLILWALMRKRADWFLIGAAAVALVLTISPVNVDNVSRWNQEARLRAALADSRMLEEGTGRIIPNPDAAQEQQETIISAANYLRNVKNVPQDSFTHQLQQQMNVDGEVIPNLQLFGFQSAGTSTRTTRRAYGSSTEESVHVAGFSYAQWYSYQYELSGDPSETLPLLPAETLLACADFASETLLTEDVQLPDGRTLRICNLVLVERDGRQESLRVRGWLLTP